MKSFVEVLALAVLSSAVQADDSGEKREAFTRKMAPQVGQRVTVKGIVTDARNGWYLMTDDGGEVYLEPANGEPDRRFEYLKNWNGKRFEISGTLGYRETSAVLRSNRANRREHFYLDTSKPIITSRVDEAR